VLERIAAAVFAIFWAVLFFGVIDLSVIASPGVFVPVVALEASWGVLFTFFVAGALLAVTWRPGDSVPAAVQLAVVAAALLTSCLLGLDRAPLPVAAVLAITSALVLRLNVLRRPDVLTLAVHRPTALAAAVAAPFWLWYAGDAFANSRERMQQDDVTWGMNHWPVHGATALALAAAALLAAFWPHGRRQLAVTTSLAGTVLGAASLAYPSSAGAMSSRAWSFGVILWSVTLGLFGAGVPAHVSGRPPTGARPAPDASASTP
jgi:hypothetical protein